MNKLINNDNDNNNMQFIFIVPLPYKTFRGASELQCTELKFLLSQSQRLMK